MKRTELLVAVIDGQGGGMGRALAEAVKKDPGHQRPGHRRHAEGGR